MIPTAQKTVKIWPATPRYKLPIPNKLPKSSKYIPDKAMSKLQIDI